MKDKYLLLYLYEALPPKDKDGNWWCWWIPDRMLKIILALEEKYPDYEYCDMITNGNGPFHEFVILKLK